MELMNGLGSTLDERGRRPWEGSSRTDVRSMRNCLRKLPFHLARERHLAQLMALVDPRIPAEAALDAARWAPGGCWAAGCVLWRSQGCAEGAEAALLVSRCAAGEWAAGAGFLGW